MFFWTGVFLLYPMKKNLNNSSLRKSSFKLRWDPMILKHFFEFLAQNC